MDNINKDISLFLNGISKVAEVVKPTYGPYGTNVFVEDTLYPYYVITNDGKVMIDKIKLANPVENGGANYAKEAGDRAEKDSGDGRKTTIILLDEIAIESRKSLANPNDIRRSLNECIPLVEEIIGKETIPITVDQVSDVASIASESRVVGDLLQQVYQKIGSDGIVELGHSNTYDTLIEVKEGVRLRNCGYMASYMKNNGEDAVYANPKILITKQKVSTINDLNPLFEQLSNKGINEIVIFCEEFDAKVLSALAYTHKQSIFKSLIIKAPILWKDWIFEDFAKITGATIVEPESGVTLKSVTLDHLGTCGKITTSADETTVIGIKNVDDHIAYLERKGEENDQMKVRAMWLNSKAALLKLGAKNDTELNYLTKKAKDGRNSAALALKGGVVQGAGKTIQKIGESMPDTVGGNILRIALAKPREIIIKNAGDNKLDESKPVVDAAIVIRNAVINAISLAGMAITPRDTITLPPKQNENISKMPGFM